MIEKLYNLALVDHFAAIQEAGRTVAFERHVNG